MRIKEPMPWNYNSEEEYENALDYYEREMGRREDEARERYYEEKYLQTI